METELEVLKLRAVVECVKFYEFYDDDIPDDYKEFYNIGKKLVSLEKEMTVEYKKTNK